MKYKKLALIGIGYWGKVHLKYLKKNKSINISNIYFKKNINIKNDKKYNKFNLTNDLDTLLDNKSIKYVDIVTPISTHADLAIKFASKGKKVLVEKPLLMNKREKNQFNQIIKKNNKLITVSYPYIFSKSLNFANDIIKKKKLGDLKFINVEINQCGRFMQFGVNHLLGPHAISILSIFYNIDQVTFDLKNIIKKNKKNETSIILCKKNNKIVGLLNLSLNYSQIDKKKNVCTIYCEKGTIICDLNDKNKTLIAYKYQRVKKENYTVAKVKKVNQKFFDEKNNMNYVIDNFLNKYSNKKNLKLTKKINSFLNNE